MATKTGYETATVTVTIMRTGTLPVTILLRKTPAAKPAVPGAPISLHELKVPDRARAAYEKGRKLLEDDGKPAESVPEFQQAVNAFPSYYEAYTEMGIANYHLGKFQEAEASLKKAIEVSSSTYLDPLYLLADLYNGQRRYQEAEPLGRQAIELDHSSWHGHFELARALVGLKRGTDAEANASEACKLKPDNASAYLVLANAHMLEGRYSSVVQDFDAYLKLEPNGPQSENIRQRRDQLQKALQSAPQNMPPSAPQNPPPQNSQPGSRH